jgi:hypothetical protein
MVASTKRVIYTIGNFTWLTTPAIPDVICFGLVVDHYHHYTPPSTGQPLLVCQSKICLAEMCFPMKELTPIEFTSRLFKHYALDFISANWCRYYSRLSPSFILVYGLRMAMPP